MNRLAGLFWIILSFVLLTGCSTSRSPEAQALENADRSGTWVGTLNCTRRESYAVRLTFWEAKADAFQGNVTLSPITGKRAETQFPVRGYRHQYGNIVLNPDTSTHRRPFQDAQKFRIGLTGRLDPDSKQIVAVVSSGCPGNLTLRPEASVGLNGLVSKYGKYDAKTQKKRDLQARRQQAKVDCVAQAKRNTGPMARYRDQDDPLSAPAYKSGLFVYKHSCLSSKLGKIIVVYSRTPPDGAGDAIEVFSSEIEVGRQVSRRDVTILPLSQVCKLFDYNIVAGQRYYCEPYGWKYTAFVRKQCLDGAGNLLGMRAALRCQFMVMGGTIKPFVRGPKQVSPR